MNAPGQYLYENYLAVFETVFAPSWRELTDESRSNWAKLELTTRIDCTCESDPLGRCVVHPAVTPSDRTYRTEEHVYWHPKGCYCGYCASGTMPVHVLTVTLPSSPQQPSSAPEKSVDLGGVRVFVHGLHSNEWAPIGWIPNRVEVSVSSGILSVNGRLFGGHTSTSWFLTVEPEIQRG
jgi:hypothetical protein